MENIENLEEQIRRKEAKVRHKKMKVFGKSVFKLQEIIKKKSKKHEKK